MDKWWLWILSTAIIDWPPPRSTHEAIAVEVIAVEAIASMPDSDHLNSNCWSAPLDQHMRQLLLRWSLLRQLPQCLTAITLTAIVNWPPPGSTHEVITVEVNTVEAIASMPDSDCLNSNHWSTPPRINTWGNHCWGDCLNAWQQSP